MARAKFYLGHVGTYAREVFRSDTEPTQETHGHRFIAVTGPFKTRRGAEYMRGHSLCQTVAEAEAGAKRQAAKDQPSGVGCFGMIDRRFSVCQRCGDYCPCMKYKQRAKDGARGH